MKTYKVTLKAMQRPYRGTLFSYTIEAQDAAAALSLARSAGYAENRIATTSVVSCREVGVHAVEA